ncbi:phage portal protein [Actinocrispum wychmicini]|uniref:SPP1 Gp6-like portal protein n=1 Tax=Actinocrispum wychmicini TaxID=1213861 RepID=A0A4R2JJU2_9PSEU|nr:phage portal protein [Actinocrispum wychmicini]TCO56789.1 SPP1 Gp6-like portal protein [Actinocrispum wychmicini]
MTTPILLDHIQQLVADFGSSQTGLADNVLYYESQKRPISVGVSTPPEMRDLLAQIGWCRVYVDSVEERLDIEGFRMAGEPKADTRLWEWWQSNRLDEVSSYAHTEALIHGRAYIVVSAPDPSDPLADATVPVIQVESPSTMWADIDYRTHRVKRAVRVIKGDSPFGPPVPDYVTIYLPDSTTGLLQGGADGWTVDFHASHNLGVVPVVPLLNRSRLTERYGRSEITPELRSVTDAAARTMMNMQATAELMAVPQRLLFGIKPEEIADDPTNKRKVFEAYIARILAFEDPEGKAQQFTAAELRNFTEVMQELAKQAATYTGLPPQYLAFASDNPASAEAIRSAESRLVKKAERKQRIFGGPWEQAMRIALLVMDGNIPRDARRMEVLWRDPATPTFAAKADAVVKLATASTPDGRPIIPVERARIDLGYSAEERRQMETWDKDNPVTQLAALTRPAAPRFSDTPDDEPAAEAA